MWNILCIQACVFVQLASITDGQAVSLPAPECYNTTTCPCCKAGTCPSDGSALCEGNCIDGYHDGKCRYRCPSNCVRCVDAPQGDGVSTCTQCKAGYYSAPTQYQCQLSCLMHCKTCEFSSSHCTSCSNGHYMISSNECAECHENCVQCLSSDKCIACKLGYYLKDNTCISCTHGCSGSRCSDSDGHCIFGCKANFTSSDIMYRCDECKAGLYGYECSRECPHNRLSYCDRLTGVCSACKTGTFGAYCSNECPSFCLSTCNKSLGQCSSCLDGFYGNNCTMECRTNCKTCTIQDGQCTLCVDGFVDGEECNTNCSEHCIIPKCDRLDGHCDCKPGYGGDQCILKVTTSTASSSTEILVVYAEDSTNAVAVVGITIGAVAVLVLVVVAVVFAYKRFRRRPVSSGVARVDMVKMRVEISTIEAAIMATEQSSDDSGNNDTEDLQIRLKELQRKLPYDHSERADRLVTENTYEQLQRQRKDEAPYASMTSGLMTTEETSGGSGNYDKVEPKSEKAHRLARENTYEQLQRQKTNESPYASLRP